MSKTDIPAFEVVPAAAPAPPGDLLPAPVADYGAVTLELMGHRHRAGRLTEVVIAGKPFLRLDQPGAAPELYPPDSVYCITPARAVAEAAEQTSLGHAEGCADVWCDGSCTGDEDGGPMPLIVVLCGSTRFYDAFQQANYELTMAGKIVLSVGFYPHATAEHGHGEGVGHDSDQKAALDELHLRKIDLADEVVVLNVGGYIGESTRREIEYATAHGKPVTYLEQAQDEL